MSNDRGGRQFATSRRRHVGGNCSCDGESAANDESGGESGGASLTEEQVDFAIEVAQELPDDVDVSEAELQYAAEEMADLWDGESAALPGAVASVLAGGMDGSEAANALRSGDGDDGAANASTPPQIVTGNGDDDDDDESGSIPDAQGRYIHDGGTPRGFGVNYAGTGGQGGTDADGSDDSDDLIPRVLTADADDDDDERT